MRYKDEQDDFFEDWEQEQRQKRRQMLERDLNESRKFLDDLERHEIDVAVMRDEILALWKQNHRPEIWSLPEAEPLINLLFPSLI